MSELQNIWFYFLSSLDEGVEITKIESLYIESLAPPLPQISNMILRRKGS